MCDLKNENKKLRILLCHARHSDDWAAIYQDDGEMMWSGRLATRNNVRTYFIDYLNDPLDRINLVWDQYCTERVNMKL